MSSEQRPRPSVRMTDEEVWAFVARGHTGILTTLRRDGVPIALPVWYATVDRTIYVGTRGRKLARIRHDPRASFLVEAGERWAELRAVHLTGRAEIVDLDGDGDGDGDGDLAARVVEDMERKYAAFRTSAAVMPGATRDAYARAERATVRFTPDDRVLHWDNRKLGLA